MTTQMLIVGGGQAGLSVAAGLRKRDSGVAITMLCAEDMLPYQRPPLSKGYLLGDVLRERLLLRPQEWYDKHLIRLVRNLHIVRIDREARKIYSACAQEFSYDKLALTLGATPRVLAEYTGENVCTVRTVSDIDILRPLMQAGKRLVVVGGGYIGLEAAAVARRLGLAVTVLEAAPRILGRVAALETADYFRQLHRNYGVEILEGVGLANCVHEGSRVAAVELVDGRVLELDLLLIGIGIAPETTLAERTGLAVDQGILVDSYARSSDRDIFAAGDCARFYYRETLLRLESVQNANDQGDCAAANMLGALEEYQPKPWFWSDQYDVKLQIAGLNQGYDSTQTRAGKRAGAQSVWYYAADRLLAVDAMNDALAYGVGKKVLDAGGSIPKEVIADAEADLKAWMRKN